MRDNAAGSRYSNRPMARAKHKNDSLFQELLATAQKLNIEVRTETLLREVGYRARSGRCRLKGQDLIIIDRDSPLGDQVEFLAAELTKQENALALLPPPFRGQLKK